MVSELAYIFSTRWLHNGSISVCAAEIDGDGSSVVADGGDDRSAGKRAGTVDAEAATGTKQVFAPGILDDIVFSYT
jgi:hypothetical protein